MASINQGNRQGGRLGNPATGAREGFANRGFVSTDPERQREVPQDAGRPKTGNKSGATGAARPATPASGSGSESTRRSR